MPRFIVRTQHPKSNQFICPVSIEANTAYAAACRRFKMQIPASRNETLALLVYREDADAATLVPSVFKVVKPLPDPYVEEPK